MKIAFHQIASVALVSSILLLQGCNQGPVLPATVTAEGVLTLDAVPVDQCTIMFIADQGNYNATAVTDKDGKFAMKAFDEKKGAVPGNYKVEFNKTVVENKGEKKGEAIVNLVQGMPKKYLSMNTSGVVFEVKKEGHKDIKFDLKSK